MHVPGRFLAENSCSEHCYIVSEEIGLGPRIEALALESALRTCPLCLKTFVVGTVFGHLSGVPREVNKRTPPKHTSQGSHSHLRAPRVIFRFPGGRPPFESKIFQNGVLEDML